MIRTAREGALHTAVIDRPDKANSLTLEMLQDLADFAEGATEEGAQAIVLTGAGEVFSAGADLEAARAGLATSPV
ncbi:enoyl-CoA hydratase-related protein, partial [Rhodosalinus sp.]|uniref:enoyl-CoA hydratase-related protein n=1 Tax=Rhodosalinus sp. TaxID=2047741 RepID=UPI00356A8597